MMQPKRRTLKMGADEAGRHHNQIPPGAFPMQRHMPQLGNKDLVIRMLAEIFQVRQDERTGQVRWHQVSTSLVPISLYSRTTSTWLDYLLTAPLSLQANDPANTMSPDSRDFLLLLQQFHQQTSTSRPTATCGLGSGLTQHQQQQLYTGRHRSAHQGDAIVFQVVGHDFIDGQCRKIMNVKIRQPGVRLGQASDYFVYWKDTHQHQQLQHQQFSASSYASNASNTFLKQPNGAYHHHHQNQDHGHHHPTWGLNFASMNDAQLFYDICSLNIVNLDFNSEYLKQLSIGDEQQQAAVRGGQFSARNATVSSPCSLIQLNQRPTDQTGVRRLAPYNQQLNNQAQRATTTPRKQRSSAQRMLDQHQDSSTLRENGSSRREASPGRQQSSVMSRCPSCRQAFVMSVGGGGGGGGGQSFNGANRDENGRSCPVHGRIHSGGVIRARSRSTTRPRAPLGGRGDLENGASSSLRARSFSTPASPEIECPVHQRRHRTNTECEVAQRRRQQTFLPEAERLNNHKPTRQHSTSNKRTQQRDQQRDEAGPEKPARGFLRSAYLLDSQESFAGNYQRNRQQQQQQGSQGRNAANVNVASTTNASTSNKRSAVGHLHNSAQQQQRQQSRSLDRRRPYAADTTCDEWENPQNAKADSAELARKAETSSGALDAPTSNRSLFRRTQTGTGTGAAETFDTLAHRNAQLARAQYAKSRNMKEFLSLDAGGFKPGSFSAAMASGGGCLPHRKQIRQPSVATRTNNNGQPVSELQAALSRAAPPPKPGRRTSSISAPGDERVTLESHMMGLTKATSVCRAGSNGSDPLQCNAATTTDDLPMDSSTRKRMLKLTSDEIISEHTEPRSVSTTTTAIEAGRAETAAATSEKLNQLSPVRAVSLGPLERTSTGFAGQSGKIRGRNARSDASRRRSLERSVGVDLAEPAAMLPAGSFKKQSRLSPLPQSVSASPQQRALDSSDCERRGDLPATRLNDDEVDMNDGDDDDDEGRYGGGQHQIYGMGHFTTAPAANQLRARQCEIRNGSATAAKRRTAGGQSQLATFKSAPDVRGAVWEGGAHLADSRECPAFDIRQPSADGCAGVGDAGDDDEGANGFEAEQRSAYSREAQQQLCGSVPRAATTAGNFQMPRSHLSSYAVPLCSTVKRPHQQAFATASSLAAPSSVRRQCHSCPNSLRRKRRPAPQDFRRADAELDYSLDCGAGEAPIAGYLGATMADNCCPALRHQSNSSQQWLPHYQHHSQQQQQQQQEPFHHGRLFQHACCGPVHLGQRVECADCAHAHDLGGHASQYLEPALQHLHHHHHLVTQSRTSTTPTSATTTMARRAADVMARHELALLAQESRQSQPNQSSSRPASSLSTRSPMQYGLYESDCDDGADQDVSSPQARPFKHCPVSAPNAVDSYYVAACQRRVDHSAGLHRPQDATQVGQWINPTANRRPVVRPVRGYDQTMSRACLKSRQRSRSQPPGGEGYAEGYNEVDADGVGGDQAANQQHITKSMENVEKLIREVQNELRTLKRHPLGAAHIDMKPAGTNSSPVASGKAPAAQSCRQLQVAEMAQEEAGLQGESPKQQHQQQLSYTSATRRAGQFKCAGAIRKAGFLSVKKWILKRRQSIELARKQGWRRYWVCLRGTALLFHSVIEREAPSRQNQAEQGEAHQQKQVDLASWIRANCSSQPNVMANLQNAFQLENASQCYIEEEPRHLIIVDGAIAQPIPEHPRRDFVFCLSTTFGDAYLFQASCQLESDNWIAAIHNACAASIARDLVRDEAIKLFETKIRHFELEAEKKLFLRHRLESRLTSMSSMCKPDDAATRGAATMMDQQADPQNARTPQSNKTTMRSLLCQLSQQLLALDSYIEQLHCETYQLRCYLSSCSAQNIFYQHLSAGEASLAPGGTTSAVTRSHQHELPHPKSLLMHVSKPTKLLLIKLGVFTVSSFHAFIHARQESAKSILESISAQHQRGRAELPDSPLVELRIRSRSISETLLSRPENLTLDNETENLIEMANLRSTQIVLRRALYEKIKTGARPAEDQAATHPSVGEDQMDLTREDQTSDDLCSIQECGQFVQLRVKLNSSADSSSIVKQVLQLIQPNCGELDFLNYFLRLVVVAQQHPQQHQLLQQSQAEPELEYFAVKRKETLEEWSNYTHIELLEKTLFRVNLARSRMDEEESAVPFGISVEGQLLTSRSESVLNVYCSYIEWGSAADKAGLQDEDEFLMLNGVPVGDLDLMFVECIIQEATRLRAVVRSCRSECAARAKRLDRESWRSYEDDDGVADGGRDHAQAGDFHAAANQFAAGTSQVISDEYLTSLVCPPPPSKSNAFLRTNTNLLRQKSDLGSRMGVDVECCDEHDDEAAHHQLTGLPKSTSQHGIDLTACEATTARESCLADEEEPPLGDAHKRKIALRSSEDLARQLMHKTERISRLLLDRQEACSGTQADELATSCALVSMSATATVVTNEFVVEENSGRDNSIRQQAVERLKKSVLELIETEYAYIRHLETIQEHYMAPLCETNLLSQIFDLCSFSQIVAELLRFQRGFFALLTKEISEQAASHSAKSLGEFEQTGSGGGGGNCDDDFDACERFNWIVQRTDALESMESFGPMLDAIATIFDSEADKFKLYAAYCVAYSKLQRILHPRNAVAHQQQPYQCVVSIPSALNVFVDTASQPHPARGDQKLFSSVLIGGSSTTEDRTPQLKQLAEFLANLDSSSSSASFSLQRSSASEQRGRGQKRPKQASAASTDASAGVSDNQTQSVSIAYQKSAHHQNFESYLIKPIQRLVKYPMLLNSIALAAAVNPTTGSGGEELNPTPCGERLHSVIKQLEAVINHVNESQRVHDEYGSTFDHIERQFFEQQVLDSCTRSSAAGANLFGPHQPPITLNIAKLLYSGPVKWLNVDEFAPKAKTRRASVQHLSSVLFVFESCVVFLCKERISSGGAKKGKGEREAQGNQQSSHQPSSSGLTSRVLQWSTGLSSSNSGAAACNSNAEQLGDIVRYHTLIPVSEVQVRSVSKDGAPGKADENDRKLSAVTSDRPYQFEWELFQCSSSNSNSGLLTKTSTATGATKQQQQQTQLLGQQQQQQQLRRNSNTGKIYLLSSSSNEERSAFLRKIRFTIRESVRNMSLPTLGTSTKSSSSYKSIGLKKLSTSSVSSATSAANINVNTSGSLSPPESSGGPDLMTQDQSTTIKCEPYNDAKQKAHETSIEIIT